MMRGVSLVLTVASVQATTFELFELPASASPHPYCNDGTQAGYYHDTDYSKLGKVHVHLQGGNLCENDEVCQARCDRDGDGVVDNRLCTASSRQVMVKEGGLYSNLSDNPLADYWHVIVPYCSSDTWAGTGRSPHTGYYFHGKYILRSLTLPFHGHTYPYRDVLKSLKHHYGLSSASDFILSGEYSV